MSYIDGIIMAVPTKNRQEFIDHASNADSFFIDMGAQRIIECWGDDVPEGKTTDFRRAVKAEDNETVVLSWIEWPDKATRDMAMKRMEDVMQTDERFDPQKNPMPFDGMRMIFGGFTPIFELRAE